MVVKAGNLSRGSFSLCTYAYCVNSTVSFIFNGVTTMYFTHTYIKCYRAEGVTGEHLSITQINHRAKAAQNHRMNWLLKVQG